MLNLTFKSEDGKRRCKWCKKSPELLRYHDTEWGVPIKNDHRLFEKLCLEGFQSGLSWRIILAKRDNFRAAFYDFDFDWISQFEAGDVDRLLCNKSIVRHRGKIEAVINNAKLVEKIVKSKGSLAAFVWSYEPRPTKINEPKIVVTTPESVALSKDLKKMGWQFVGPTTVYSFMQAMGMVNDHAVGCVVKKIIERTRKKFKRP